MTHDTKAHAPSLERLTKAFGAFRVDHQFAVHQSPTQYDADSALECDLPECRAKALVDRLRADPEATCQRCGGTNPSWHAASPLWNAVLRSPDGTDRWDVLCPSCFAALANEQGHHVCLTVHGDLPTDPHGREFDREACLWVEGGSPPNITPDIKDLLERHETCLFVGGRLHGDEQPKHCYAHPPGWTEGVPCDVCTVIDWAQVRGPQA